MKLAIVIPYFKRDFFEETLSSLTSQTNKQFHVYIGNDSSPDDPEEIINKYRESLEITYKSFDRNLGRVDLTAQWDRCINMIKDESWIMILGDDDRLSPEVVSSFYRCNKDIEENSKLVRFASKILFSDGSSSEVYKHPKLENAGESFLRRYYGETRSSLSEYIFFRPSYEKYGFYNYPLAWHSDDRAWLEFSESKPIYSINEAIVYFRHSNVHITGRDDNLKAKDLSSMGFYKYLSKKKNFSKEHRLLFARNFERYARKSGQLRSIEWLKLIYIYMLSFDTTAFIKLLKRIIKQQT